MKVAERDSPARYSIDIRGPDFAAVGAEVRKPDVIKKDYQNVGLRPGLELARYGRAAENCKSNSDQPQECSR